MHSLMRQLKHTLEKQLRVWLDVATLETYITAKMTPRRLRWDMHPNDNINDAGLMADWFSLFNKCEGELLQNIVKRRQFKLRMIETNIAEIKGLLVPFASQRDYKDKEKELQEHIKKYDGEIQAKKQKKFKRDVLDYKNNRVYKWQSNLEDASNDMEDTLMEDPLEEGIEARILGLRENTPPPGTPVYPMMNTRGRPRTPQHYGYTPNQRRVSYREPSDQRTSRRFHVPTHNRFSPLRNVQYSHPSYGREYEDQWDFRREDYQDRPPGRWKACVPYRTPGWRAQRGNGGGPPRGGARRLGNTIPVGRQEPGEWTHPNNGREYNQERNRGPTPGYPERRGRQEEGEEVGRKRRRVY